MDTHLRILERRAQASGSVGDWKQYAQALRRVIGGENIGKIHFWIVIEQDPMDLFRVETTLHATETEAKGKIVKGYLEAAKPHITTISSDEDVEWHACYAKFTSLIEDKKFDEAWEYYHGDLDGNLFDGLGCIDLLPLFGLERHPLPVSKEKA